MIERGGQTNFKNWEIWDLPIKQGVRKATRNYKSFGRRKTEIGLSENERQSRVEERGEGTTSRNRCTKGTKAKVEKLQIAYNYGLNIV